MKPDRPKNIIVAVTGASGSIYARLFCEELKASGDQIGEIAVIFSENGRLVAQYEDTLEWASSSRFTCYDNADMFSAPASGSARYDAMVVIPCSMGTLGRIAGGVSGDLIGRAADVMLKERRKLILVTRETPLSAIHLKNMAALAGCGAVICPASPSFYAKPNDIEGLCRSVVERVMSLLDIDSPRFEWSGKDAGSEK